MNSDTRKMIRIRALEDRARKVQQELDTIEETWKQLYDELSPTPGWEQDCKARGLNLTYDFHDILC
jgi:hypothetical protein